MSKLPTGIKVFVLDKSDERHAAAFTIDTNQISCRYTTGTNENKGAENYVNVSADNPKMKITIESKNSF